MGTWTTPASLSGPDSFEQVRRLGWALLNEMTSNDDDHNALIEDT
jgi:hypothetical protein